jgi:hypothetical protein
MYSITGSATSTFAVLDRDESWELYIRLSRAADQAFSLSDYLWREHHVIAIDVNNVRADCRALCREALSRHRETLR